MIALKLRGFAVGMAATIIIATTAFSGALTRPPAPESSRLNGSVVVNGDMWMSSSQDIRKAFLLGATNMAALEEAHAKRLGVTPSLTEMQTAKALSTLTLDEISNRITRWYETNPTRRNVPVIGVIWVDIVKPK